MASMTQFLKEQKLTASCFDIAAEIKAFREEMERGLKGEKSSLFMIPTFICPSVEVQGEDTLIVLDAGGTNLRVGTVSFSGGKVQDVRFEKSPLPGTDRTLTCEEFFDAVAERLAPYLDAGDRIGFCFSYVAHCMEDKDAKLEAFCKEVRVTGAEGVEICKELDRAIHRRGVEKTFRYVQLNDTVATMLGGMAAARRTDYDGFMGFILGTGTNGCYGERTENIRKYSGSVYREKTMVINMESGCYGGFAKGEIDRQVDEASAVPGDHAAEKMISGAYLGQILARAVHLAHRQGILAGDVEGQEIPLPLVNDFLEGKAQILGEEDAPALRELIEGLYSRTARLLAIIFTAVAEHTGMGRKKPLAIVMEGSTFWKSPRLQAFLNFELEYMTQFYGCSFSILGAENPTLTGAAFAALSNT